MQPKTNISRNAEQLRSIAEECAPRDGPLRLSGVREEIEKRMRPRWIEQDGERGCVSHMLIMDDLEIGQVVMAVLDQKSRKGPWRGRLELDRTMPAGGAGGVISLVPGLNGGPKSKDAAALKERMMSAVAEATLRAAGRARQQSTRAAQRGNGKT